MGANGGTRLGHVSWTAMDAVSRDAARAAGLFDEIDVAAGPAGHVDSVAALALRSV